MAKNKTEMKDMKDPQVETAKVIPFDDTDHASVILDKEQVKLRNEATKDYSKILGAAKRGHGPGRGMYLGKGASDKKGTIKRLWNYLGFYKVGLIIVVIAIFITTILAVYLPKLFGAAIDTLKETSDFTVVYDTALIVVGIALLNSLVSFISKYVMVIVSQKTVKKIRKDAFDKLQNLPVSYYDKNQAGDIVSRITNDVDLVSNSLTSVVTELIKSVIMLIGSLYMMFTVNWALAIVVLVFVPLMGYITMKVGKITRKGFVAQQKHLGSLNGIIEENISGLRVIKLYGQEDTVVEEFAHKNEELRNASFRAQVAAGIIMPIVTFLNNLIYILIVALGAIFNITGIVAVSVGNIASITFYARQFVQPIAQLAQLFNTMQQGLAGAERVFGLIDELDEYENDGDIDTQAFKGEVEFKEVTFGYDEGVTVLEDINFSANSGETIAIVGPTGSGKTTIINLLNRFYDIDSGHILIDGTPITKYKKDSLRKRIGVVLQDTSLFSGTVYDNILYGNHEASEEDIEKAATLANAHDFIMKLPEGYQSEVYEGGQNFSQGERQLISIARTILSNPDILILDEATSNVDTRTEFRIQESMKTLMKGRTSFVIAHRLQTIRNAHKILVIKEGKLIESGSHKELLKEEGFYYDLYTTQFKDLVNE